MYAIHMSQLVLIPYSLNTHISKTTGTGKTNGTGLILGLLGVLPGSGLLSGPFLKTVAGCQFI